MLNEIHRNLVGDIVVPYMVRSEIKVKMVNVITYYQLLEIHSKEMQKRIQSLDPSLLNDSVFLFEVNMTP